MHVEPRLAQVQRRAEEVRTPGSPIAGVRRLVVVRDDRLGDLVLTLPAVAAIRETYPAARLGLMVAPPYAPLAACVTGVDRVLESSATAEPIKERLESFGPDLVVSVSRRAVTAWAAWRARIEHRVGAGYRVQAALYSRRVNEHRRRGARHEVEYALSFAHRVGASPGPPRFPLQIHADAGHRAGEWLARRRIDDRFVVLHPGSGGSCPRWPAEHFRRLGDLLAGAGAPVVYTLGPSDRPVAEGLDDSGAHRLVGADPSLLAAVLQRAALVIGSSTGPVHLAAAVNTATLAIHAPWPTCGVGRWGPYSPRGWAVVAHHPPAERWSQRERARKADALMAAIRPETVFTAAAEMFAGRPPRLHR
jgi:ADP-heptose:LPS heptosyltransferase